MTPQELKQLKYPIGVFKSPKTITQEHIKNWITVLEKFPLRLKQLTFKLTDKQLDTSYRPQGWTIRQVVHHVSDSHHHSYIRFKWALTEEKPIIKPYFESRWAELEDAKTAPIHMSLSHLETVHYKLVYLLKGLSFTDMDKTFIHPEMNAEVSLKKNIGIYAWHSNHHYAHIENLLIRNGWK